MCGVPTLLNRDKEGYGQRHEHGKILSLNAIVTSNKVKQA